VTPAPGPARILVVDDNADLADNLAEVLSSAGYAVRCAATCGAALELARADGFDVAMVDLRLPDGDGNTLAPRLKELSPDGQVVLLTGFATLESAVRAVRAGACAYLVKPCAMEELLLAVEQALRQVRLHAERRELARRARTAEKLAAVGTMTAGLSHEIRNPLNAAALQLSLLERRLQLLAPEQQGPLREPLALVKDEIRRLDHILEDFLQFARPKELEARPIELSALIRKVLDLLGGELERREVRLVRQLSPEARVRGDEERLRQVLMNLFLNALEAVGAGGQVCVSCAVLAHDEPEGAAHWVEVLVDDDGPGFPPGAIDRIFEPFFTTKAKGSGLGLSIVHAITAQHGGTIEAERSPLGGGRMILRLPWAPP
jgi:two-component system, NtrC family, sensor histidine kinase HydH